MTIDAGPVWQQLYQDSYHSLLRLAVLLTSDRLAAEDAVQDAFIGFWRRVEALDDPGAARGYLRTAVVNNSRSVLRRRRTAGKHLRDLHPPDPPGADHALMTDIRDQELRAAVEALPRRQREVVVLRYWSELSLAEVAQTLGVSIGTVKSTASRAMDRLEQALGDTR
ncbi:RNA polymerase sigma-70 factor (sigma-E family) [Nakamurella sp. UYEF19]|uniref:RNA polymerase sigma factor n=1 Tax=Nakamurella sp. UYEF19 TaxID=1756392 RepID=UPI0033958002